jgi:transcription-repair coupling factor (superfamily II helicase)
MYIKLLSEAILEERGEVSESKTDCTVNLSINAYLPDNYIFSTTERMMMYKKIAHIRDKGDVEDIYEELCDRYGEPPESALFLLDISLMRAYAERAGIHGITQEGRQITIVPVKLDIDVWSELTDTLPVKIRVVLAENPYLVLTLRANDDPIAILCDLFKKYIEISSPK